MIRAVLALLLAATTTAAGPNTYWRGHPCRAGTIDISAPVIGPTELEHVTLVTLPGTLACGARNASFAVITYDAGNPEGILLPRMQAPFARPPGPTRFHVAVGVERGLSYRLCLMPRFGTELACVRVTADMAGAITVNPEAPPGLTSIGLGHVAPQCGTCWTVSTETAM